MYGGSVVLTSDNVISILATASLFLMQELIDQCAAKMIETIDKENVILYHDASETYGLSNVKSNALQWLELNLLICLKEENWEIFLKAISLELMTCLMSSHNFINGRLYSVYYMLRKW